MIRWLVKADGSRVLQAKYEVDDYTALTDWQDVPTEVDKAMRHNGDKDCPICSVVAVPSGQSYAACYGRKFSTEVEKPEPRKPRREWWVEPDGDGFRCWEVVNAGYGSILQYFGKKPNWTKMIKVREVLPDDK